MDFKIVEEVVGIGVVVIFDSDRKMFGCVYLFDGGLVEGLKVFEG